MKRGIIVFILLNFTIHCIAQDYKKDIEKQFLDYCNLIIKKDFKEAVNYMNSAMFETVSKEELVRSMEQIFNSEDFIIDMVSVDSIQVGNMQKIDMMNYALLRYRSELRMKFLNLDNEAEKSTTDREMILLALQAQFGKDNITYDKKTDFYTMGLTKSAIANSSDLKKWQFVVVEQKQLLILSKFIPKKILEKAL